jgi:hypothetical protein
MDSPASGAQIGIVLHPIDQQMDCFRLKVNVAIKSQEKRVLCNDPFPFR